jgi:tryptophan synthase beta chain
MAQLSADRQRTKYTLDEADLPTQWYNIQADLKTPLPPVLHPGTGQPIGPQDLAPLFPMALIQQEVSGERWIDIPDAVRQVLRLWRPTPLFRARRLEQALDTPAHLYYKYEGVSPAGSHKPNTAAAQAYYNKLEVRRLTTETGAGQWGSALAMACRLFDLHCTVYMVRVSYEQKPYRRLLMETWGAQVVPSPTPDTQAGRQVLAQEVQSPGSLGIAISEAVEDAVRRDDTHYALGSVLNHVLLHQTVIGLEAKKQLQQADDEADIVIGCAGGGSNFAGLAFPFAADKLAGAKPRRRLIAVEPTACPSLTQGRYVYDFGDAVGLTPLVKMHTLGHTFVPAPLHAGGLRYHGMAPLVCKLYDEGVIEAVAVPQRATFEAALQFARTEGIIPAPESAHAIRVAIDEARRCKEAGVRRTILFNLSGHGYFDLGAYEAFLAGRLQDYDYPAEKVSEALQHLPASLLPLPPAEGWGEGRPAAPVPLRAARDAPMIKPYTAVGLVPTVRGIRTRADIERNLEHLAHLVKAAAWLSSLDLPVRPIALPEGALQGFNDEVLDLDHAPCARQCAIDIPGEETAALGQLARDYDVFIMAQAKARHPDWPERFFNVGFILNPQGEVILQRYKVSPLLPVEHSVCPHDIYDWWIEKYGRTLQAFWPVVDTEIGRLGIMMANEGSYPENARALALNGAEVVYRASYPHPATGNEMFEIQSRARALDNNLYLVAPNMGTYYLFPEDATPIDTFGGRSFIINYKGQIVGCQDYGGGSTYVAGVIDIEALRDHRARAQWDNC